MNAPLSALAPTLLALAGLCLAMVVVMVRFSAAMITPRPRHEAGEGAAGPGERRVAVLGALYLLSWAAIIAAFLRLFALLGEPLTGRRMMIPALAAAGWLAFNALWIALARKLLRVNARAAAAAGAADPGEPRQRWEGEAPAGRAGADDEDAAGRLAAAQVAAEIHAAGRADPATVQRPAPAPRPWWRRALSTLLLLVVVFAALVLGEALTPLRELEAFLAAHRTAFAGLTAAVAGLGFVLLMTAAVQIALAQGRPLERREIDAMRARGMAAGKDPAPARGGAYRSHGEALGASGSEEVSFREMKVAFRARAWTFSRRWRRIFTAAAGGALLFFGLFGLAFVLAPAGIKLLAAAAIVYAVARTARGFARA